MLGNHEYQFTLGNFTKPKSLFNNGMKVLMYSKNKEKKESIYLKKYFYLPIFIEKKKKKYFF